MKLSGILWLILGIFICFGAFAQQVSEEGTPVGKWLQISDETGQPRTVIQIFKDKQGKLDGKIIKTFVHNGVKPQKYCVPCYGNLQGKKIIGLTILHDFVQTGENEWSNGYILNLKNGETYKGNIAVKDYGEHLKVRGYIGVSLFGRTQEWIRIG